MVVRNIVISLNFIIARCHKLIVLLLVIGQIFEPFGPVELVQLPLDLETGQCKGFGFVQVSDNFRFYFSLFFIFSEDCGLVMI